MPKFLKDTITLKNTKAADIYKEVIGFMAVHGYYLYQSIEPVKIGGKKRIQEENGLIGTLLSKYKGEAELDIGLWERGKGVTVVIDFTEDAAQDADTIKGILLHKFSREEKGKK